MSGPRTDLGSAPTAMPEVTGGTMFAVGDVIAERYEVHALLGQGGMGAVFRVHDRELDEEVALKVLHPALSLDGRALERFRREVKLARRVTHPNVARTFDMGFDRVRFLTMELVIGAAVSNLVREGARPPLPEALRIAEAVSRGLSAAHAAGVVHRDLKPDNVMRGPGAAGRIVITDFGIARLATVGDDAHRRTGDQIAGTPAYMAPEQITAQPLDGRTDVYALGVMTFELLTGRLPFARETALASAAARLTEDPPDVRTFAPDVPEPIAVLVGSMLARRREERPDAETVLQAIERLRGARDDRRTAAATIGPPPNATKRVSTLIAVAPMDDVADAIADGLSAVRGAEVCAPTAMNDAMRDGSSSLVAAKAMGAALVVDGSVRTQGENRRARARILAVPDGRQLWASPAIDGGTSEGFAFEDRVVRAVVDAVSERLGEATLRGPEDPAAREIYERGRAYMRARTIESLRESVAALEEGLQRFPRDPFIMASLGTALVRLYGVTGARTQELATRGEELSLRALALDPSIGESYYAITVLRYEQGEVRAALRALEETLARSPRFADAHSSMGMLLADAGRVEEAMRRFETALTLDPKLTHAWLERARIRALLGDRVGSEQDLAQIAAFAGPGATTMLLVRAVIWWRDREAAGKLAEEIAKSKTGAAWERAGPFLAAFARGDRLPVISPDLRQMAGDASIAPRNTMRVVEVAAEIFAATGDHENAMQFIERIDTLPFTDLIWLDRCPNLDPLRGEPAFARVRAKVAARTADIWR